MGITRKIPLDAKPIVEMLRRDVERPRSLPVFLDTGSRSLVWFIDDGDGHVDCACPMGLHPKATNHMPTSWEHFFGWECESRAIRAFARWWDEQTDRRAAVDAVWPRKSKQRRVIQR